MSSIDDNNIDKFVKSMSIAFLIVFLLLAIFDGIILVGNILFGVNTNQSTGILLTLLWSFFLIFYVTYIYLFVINFPSKPDGIKKRKERNRLKEKLITITGMTLICMFLGITIFIGFMIGWSILLGLSTMLPLEVVLINLGCIFAIFFIQLITLWLMNNSIKKVEQKKAEAEEYEELRKQMELKKHIPKTVKEAKDYLIYSYKAGKYKPKLAKEDFRKALGKLSDGDLIKDYFAVKEEETLIKFNLWHK